MDPKDPTVHQGLWPGLGSAVTLPGWLYSLTTLCWYLVTLHRLTSLSNTVVREKANRKGRRRESERTGS